MVHQQVFWQWPKVIMGIAATALLSFQSFAESLTHQQWQTLQRSSAETKGFLNRNEKEFRDLFRNGDLEKFLQQRSANEEIYLRGRLLRELGKALNPLKGEHLEDKIIVEWVKQQKLSQESIKIPNQDHPQHQIVAVNIQGIANSTYRWWEIKQHISIFESETVYSPNLQRWLTTQDKVQEQALELWIKSLNQKQISVAVKAMLANNTTDISKPILVAFARQSQNPELFNLIWHMPVDELSYQLVQSIPQYLPANEAISQLMVVSQHQKLQSQAMLVLANHYLNANSVQNFLTQSLAQKEQFWSAMMALKQNASAEFWEALVNRQEDIASKLSSQQQQALNRVVQSQGEIL